MFVTHTVSKQTAVAPEQLGSKSKFWYVKEDRRMLFKAEERGTGEDWAEKIACHLCELLGLGHVHYELAELIDNNNKVNFPGVICESCTTRQTSLVLGNQLLLAIDASYPADHGNKYKVRAHTVEAVASIVKRLSPPADVWMANVPTGIRSALDVFAGYTMLDAWIANQDRHHENWGALVEEGSLRLAPTFDHGAALARNVSDEERQIRLTRGDRNRTIELFASRARSAFYKTGLDQRSLGTIDCFREFALSSSNAGRIWLEKLQTVKNDEIRGIVEAVPEKRMSRVAKEFTLELLQINRSRLLNEQV